MFRGITLLFLFCTLVAAADPLLPFYREALATVGTGQMAALETQKSNLAVSGAETDRYSALSLDVLNTYTTAKRLNAPFQTTDIVFSDTIDLFGKQRDNIEALHLQSLGNLRLLDIQKQQLFTALTDLVVSYRKSEALSRLHDRFYRQQSTVLEALRNAVASGSFPRMDADRFAQALSLLEVQLIKEHKSVDSMKAQLTLYAPGHPIPSPQEQNLSSDEQSFIAHSPQLRYTTLHARALAAQATGAAKQWHPDIVVGAAYQFNDDPTANGDNYAFVAGIHMAFGGGFGKNAEAAQVASLQATLEGTRQRVKVRQQFLLLHSEYESAVKVLGVLEHALVSAETNAQTMQNAYLKHFIDFTTYLQSIQQLLSLREQQIDARYQAIRNAQLLNTFSRGEIYE